MQRVILEKNTLIAKKYEVLECINIGAFSSVYKVRDIFTNILYAFKKIFYTEATYQLENEISILKQLSRDDNFLNYYGKVEDDEDVYLKFEFLTGRNLKKIIEEDGLFTEKQAIKLLSDITEQLYFAHQNNIIHNDIKPQNIVEHNGKYYLLDWGVSLIGEQKNYDKALTDEMFLTPEHYNAQVLFKSDIYALGHVIYFTLHGHLLYRIFSQMSSIQVMLFHFTKEIEYKENLSVRIKKILANMLCREYEKRVDIQALYNLFLKFEELEDKQCSCLRTPPYKLDTNQKILVFLSNENILLAKFLFAVYLEDNKKYKEAIIRYVELAKKGFTRAMNNLGYLYEANNGVKRDYKLSSYWYFKAGKLGNAMAIYNMAKVFKYGKGVEKDPQKAQNLFRLAQKHGYIKEILLNKYDEMIDWIRKHGGYIHPQLYINTQKVDGKSYNGVYFQNIQAVDKDLVITTIPDRLCITEDTYKSIDNIEECLPYVKGEKNNIKTVIALIYETLKEGNSFFYSYINSLPDYESFIEHPIHLFYKNKEVFKLLNPLLVSFNRVMESKVKDLQECIDSVTSIAKNTTIFSKDISSLELEKMIVWSFLIVTTRTWKGKLIPFNDCFNHKQTSDIKLIIIEGKKKFYSFAADNQLEYEKNTEAFEVFAHYGHYDLMSFEMYYDFLPQNRINFLALPFRLNSDEPLEKLKILEIKKNIPKFRKIVLANEKPSEELRAMMRILSLNLNEYEIYSKKDDEDRYYTKLSEENELRSLQFLLKVLVDLKNLNYTVDAMKETHSLVENLNDQKLLSAIEVIMKNVCIIKIREYQIIEENLAWVYSQLNKTERV